MTRKQLRARYRGMSRIQLRNRYAGIIGALTSYSKQSDRAPPITRDTLKRLLKEHDNHHTICEKLDKFVADGGIL